MKTLYKKSAFSMIELVMVIIVLGILAVLAIPRMERDRTQEAADMILSDIRYAQHMAINDYREDPRNSKWQSSFWQMKIENCANGTGLFITVGADKDNQGDISKTEAAIDPTNGKPMFWENTSECSDGGDDTVSENIFIYKKFGVKSINSSGGCNGVQYIGFDHLGRAHVGFSSSTTPDYSSYMNSNCIFNFEVEGSDSFSITIEAETGYAYISNQVSS